MQNYCVILLTCTRQETGNINKTYNRNIERIAETNETRSLAACINVKHTGIARRLVCNNTNALTVKACKTYNDVLCKLRLHLKELAVVSDSTYDLVHIVCHIRVFRNNLIQDILHTVYRVSTFLTRCFLHVV